VISALDVKTSSSVVNIGRDNLSSHSKSELTKRTR